MTDNFRVLLWMSVAALAWLSYTTWMRDYGPTPPPTTQQTTPVAAPNTSDAPPELPDLTGGTSLPAPPATTPTAPSAPIHVRTDVLDVWIDPAGGDLVRSDLLEYPVHKDQPDQLVRLLDFEPQDRFVFQSGFRQAGEGPEPNHLAAFTSPRERYELAPGQNELVVRLDWQSDGPLSAAKIYTFRRGDYRIDLDLEIENASASDWQGAPYVQLDRLHNPVKRSYTSVDSYSFTGPVLYDGDRYAKLDVEDLRTEPLTQTVTNGWLASIQHHFLAAAIPPSDQAFTYQANMRGDEYVLRAVGEVRSLAPGQRLDYPLTLFVGPKLRQQLEATADGLDLTVDFGVLTVLAKPLFWVLDHVHGYVGNWGWAIILVTLMIKLAFYKLTQTSGRSMAKMRKLAPRLKTLQERYKDDRAALSQAMMELYKREKVNPAAGCLPMLIQMPFFFAFYWVLIESVEMRQAPFALWINDLSSRDPYFVLPLFMGAAMLLQTRLNPAPPDPMQARVMQIMPIVFTGFFAFFPAGLVLYWLTNTVLSMLQQWRINKLIAAE
jgi:YidC/Oxa1 family membrane protein insertase